VNPSNWFGRRLTEQLDEVHRAHANGTAPLTEAQRRKLGDIQKQLAQLAVRAVSHLAGPVGRHVVSNAAQSVLGIDGKIDVRKDHDGSTASGLISYLPYIDDICIPDPNVEAKCVNDGTDAHFEECEDVELKGGLDMLCYYERVMLRIRTLKPTHSTTSQLNVACSQPWQVNQICTSNGRSKAYRGIFSQGYENVQAANAHFASAFGDSYAYLNPTVYAVAQQAAQSVFAAPDLAHRRDICVSDSFSSSMSIDEVRTQTLLTRAPLVQTDSLAHCFADRAELRVRAHGGLL
jgi:hypothetical protein